MSPTERDSVQRSSTDLNTTAPHAHTSTQHTAGDVASAWDTALSACRDAGIDVQAVHDAQGCADVCQAFADIWGAEVMGTNTLVALAHAGNLVAVIRHATGTDGKETTESIGSPAIGGAAGFSGPAGMPYHSHIVGVKPHETGRGVGRAVKLWQRAWCLERGFDAMTWSYDPLVARNAYFNIQRLGARPVEYNANFYGEMTDAVNAGQGSDRILIHWDLTKQPASGSSGTEGYPAAHQALSNVDGAPSQYTPPPTLTAGPGREEPVTTSRVAVPEDIESLRRHDPELAKIWRYRSREALIDLMDSGFQITGFDTEGSSSAGSGSGSGHYVLTRSSSAEVSEH